MGRPSLIEDLDFMVNGLVAVYINSRSPRQSVLINKIIIEIDLILLEFLRVLVCHGRPTTNTF